MLSLEWFLAARKLSLAARKKQSQRMVFSRNCWLETISLYLSICKTQTTTNIYLEFPMISEMFIAKEIKRNAQEKT